MSLNTGFPFKAYAADLKTRPTLPRKDGLSLSLMTSEEMERLATVEVRTCAGREAREAPWQPVRQGQAQMPTFYDTRMGNFDLRPFPTRPCTTCAAEGVGRFGNERCPGHFGLVRMPRRYPGDPRHEGVRVFVVNPHLAKELTALARSECFFCHRLRAPTFDVARYRQALRLADLGLGGEAEALLVAVPNSRRVAELAGGPRNADERVINTEGLLAEHVERIIAAKLGPAALGNNNNNNNNKNSGEGGGRTAAIRMCNYDLRARIAAEALEEFRQCKQVCARCGALSPKVHQYRQHLFFDMTEEVEKQAMALGVVTREQLRQWRASSDRRARRSNYYKTSLLREHIKMLCMHESSILAALFPHLGEASVALPFRCPLPHKLLYKVFFMDKVLVPPLPQRLSSGVQVMDSGRIVADDQTTKLSAILQNCDEIEDYYLRCNTEAARAAAAAAAAAAEEEDEEEDGHHHHHPKRGRGAGAAAEAMAAAEAVAVVEDPEALLRNLQLLVNELYGDMVATFAKKEGLFRMNMMGKRVNQACRSVISPDPLVEPNEVLLPRPFARQLTFPEQVMPHSPARLALLQRCVLNGPDVYPGATHLELRESTGEVLIRPLDVPAAQRAQYVRQYFGDSDGTLLVHRHVLDGDRLIFNRQPTLHKVSMMAYRAKVLSGLKTLRFHYVNGKSYNADFDGDEMNIHVPQSVEAKAELDCIMDANLNYLLATSGKPIRGLIQDHIAAGVLLTLRDNFYTREEFTQAVFVGLSPYLCRRRGQRQRAGLAQLIPVPAILKPRALWSGKQLISVLVRYVSGADGAAAAGGANNNNNASGRGATLQRFSLVQPKFYTTTDLRTGELLPGRRQVMDDNDVTFLQSELITGVLCKNQLGPSDQSIVHVVYEVYGPHRAGELLGALGRVLTHTLQREGFSMGMDDMCLVHEDRREELLRELDEAPLALPDDEALAMPKIMEKASKIQAEFVPGRMLVPFPRNQLLMMTVSGAKGSNTNTIQMSLGLGQQLFDGRRVARMNSRKTLPPFFAGETRARSFGYAMGRFASGIRPAEYTVHAMAGRDGLIDTAVKTANSGQLQRCLIKGLESVVAHWDHSVRDANGSVLQFAYGGDGLDPNKSSALTAWRVLQDNLPDTARRLGVPLPNYGTGLARLGPGSAEGTPVHAAIGARRARREDSPATAALREAVEREAARDPLPPHVSGGLDAFVAREAKLPPARAVEQLRRWQARGELEERAAAADAAERERLRDAMRAVTTHKRLRAYVEAGDPVGLLAAQAAGEPSTQMTLNTFHSAGSTVSHVTEGIPRLRELLMYASVKNVAVVCPVEKAGPADEEALRRILGAGVAIPLRDCLARAPPAAASSSSSSADMWAPLGGDGGAQGAEEQQPAFEFQVTHEGTRAVLTVALLFSRARLQERRTQMHMSLPEHVTALRSALGEFGKRIVAGLRNRSRGGAGEDGSGGAAGEGDDDDTAAAVPSGVGRGDKYAGSGSDDDDDEDEKLPSDAEDEAEEDTDEDEGGAAAASKRRKSKRAGAVTARGGKSGGKRSAAGKEGEPQSDGDGESDDDDGSASGSSAAGGEDDGNTTNAPDDEADDGEAEAAAWRRQQQQAQQQQAQQQQRRADGAYDYTTMDPLLQSYASQRFRVHVEPLRAAEATAAGRLPPLPADLFVVNVVVGMPADTVAVIPDLIARALAAPLPTWLPQFRSITFTRSLDDPTSGTLVFQGDKATTTVRRATELLSLFCVRAPAVKLHRVRSTDIQDMCDAHGVESGYRALFDELHSLFRSYSVKYHHLSLIADAATHRGRWENFNFTGVVLQSASPLFQMTFGSAKKFLHAAVTRGVPDELTSPSAAIMVGKPPLVGTATTAVAPQSAILGDVVEHTF